MGHIRKSPAYVSKIVAVAISSDGKRILSDSPDDDTIKLWDISGKLIRIFEGHSKSVVGYLVHSVAISPDGNQILSGSDDKTI